MATFVSPGTGRKKRRGFTPKKRSMVKRPSTRISRFARRQDAHRNSIIKSFGQSEDSIMTKMARHMPAMARAANTITSAGKTATMVTDIINFVNGEQGKVPAIKTETVTKVAGANQINPYHVFTTNLTIGRPNSRGLKLMAKLFGTRHTQPANTITQSWPGSETRAALKQDYGWNQKLFFQVRKGMFSTDDMQLFYNLDTYKSPSNSLQRNYAAILDTGVNWKITNSNRFLPVIATAYIIRPRDYERSRWQELMTSIFQGTIAAGSEFVQSPDLSTQAPNKVPIIHQLNSVSQDLITSKCLAGTRCRPAYAEEFKEKYAVVEKVSKKLLPGDIWNFNYKRTYRSGIDLAKHFRLVNSSNANFDTTTDCYTLWTFNGTPVEIVQESSNDRWIGTAPGKVTLELNSFVDYIPNPDQTIVQSGDFGGLVSDNANFQGAVRIFSSRTGNDRRYNVNFDVIGDPATAGNTHYIPITTDASVQYAARNSGV